MSKQVENQDSSLRYAFAAFDTEKKGRVYAHNLQHGMAALGHRAGLRGLVEGPSQTHSSLARTVFEVSC